MSEQRRRVVVTGMGVKAPGALTVEELWSTLGEAKGVGAPVRRFDASSLPVRFACEVPEFDLSAYVKPKDARRLDRATELAVGAGLDAVADAGDLATSPERCGVFAGTGLGGFETVVSQVRTCFESGPERMSPRGIPMLMPNAGAANLAMLLGWTGPALCMTTACAAGAHAIGEACRLIQEGVVDVMLAGAAESCVTPFAIGSFWRMGILSERNEAPAEACRPFDAAREGFVLGEGSAFVVLEDLEHARQRGARVYAELAGYGRNCDASHVSSPSAGGIGAAACMELALNDARLPASAVAGLNAHGTGTLLNDQCEAEAVTKVFGSSPPPLTAPKGVTGHLLGAAGAVEAVGSVLSVTHRELPPTANYEQGDADVCVDVVAGEPRPLRDGAVMSNSFGFGGHNASLLFTSANALQEQGGS